MIVITLSFVFMSCFIMLFCAKYKKITCRHNWVILKEEVIPSVLRRYKNVTDTNLRSEMISDAIKLALEKHIQIYTCTNCGKIKKIVSTF